MSFSVRTAFACLMVILSLLSLVNVASGISYPSSYNWGFQNNCYLGFNQQTNFTDAPHLGVPRDNGLVGNWSLDEGAGSVVHDGSGNGNNGTISGATWTLGKFGNALNFLGNGSVSLPKVNSSQGAFSVWIKPASIGSVMYVVSSSAESSTNYYFGLRIDAQGYVTIAAYNNSAPYNLIRGSTILQAGQWYQVIIQSTGAEYQIFVNGVPENLLVQNGNNTGGWLNSVSLRDNLILGALKRTSTSAFFTGLMDEVSIYNRTLSLKEVMVLYSMGPYARPDSVAFSNYYNFTDPVSNNTMLIKVDSQNANSSNNPLVSCTGFFESNRLVFQANDSATVNLWTNLGSPVFTTGVWNSQNDTTTLTLNPFSPSELNWNTYNITTFTDAHSNVTPANITVGYGSNQTLSFNATAGYSLNVVVDGIPQGQISNYTLNNVAASHTVNITSTLLNYTITATADSHSTISPSGVVSVSYGGSKLFMIQANSGYNITNVYIDNVDVGAISNYTFSNVQANHTISLVSSIFNFTINASTDSNGSAAPSGPVAVGFGQTQQFNFTANTGYHISKILVDNAAQSIADWYIFSNVQRNHTISVSFAINTYNITAYTDAHSIVSPSNVSVNYGGNQTVNFNVAAGYSFDVAVDGVSQGQISSYVFSNVTAQHSVNITSAILRYTISASADSGSTVSPSGDVPISYGGSQLFTVQNKTGYNVTHVYVDNVDKGAISNYTFSNVTGNHLISVSSESLSGTNSPTPTPALQPETNQFPTETPLIAIIVVLVAINLVLVFRKVNVTIETDNEQENPQEEEPTKGKKPEVSPDETLDY